MSEKKSLIMEYITEDECCYMCDNEVFDCESCSSFEECYLNANNKCNKEFAESINYGGCCTEEEFWEQLMD